MKYRKLGQTGLEISEIGFGAWGIGGGWGSKDDAEAVKSLQHAFNAGVNFYDTAYAYGDGHSEELIGRAFKGCREKIVIASKVPPKTLRWPTLDSEPVKETFPARWIVDCTERTLQKLGTDHIDLQQLHAWSDPYVEQAEWHEAMCRLRKDGKVLHFGVSANDWEPYNTVRLVESGMCDSVQVIYNIFEQRPAEKLLPAALKHNVGIIVRVPFEEGLLTGKFRPDHKFEEGDWRGDWLTPERLEAAEPKVKALEAELDSETCDLPALALKFVLAHPAVSTVIPGMRSCRHVDANCAVSGAQVLSPARVDGLKRHAFVHGWTYPWSQKK